VLRSRRDAGLCGLVLVLGLLVPWSTPARAASPPGLGWSVTLDGRDVGTATGNRPLRLRPGRALPVLVRVTAAGSQPVKIRDVKLEGRVLGLAFFTYATQVDLSAAPGTPDERRYDINLIDLQGEATGLLPARVVLYDDKGSVVATRSLVVDVRGSLRSVYGTFGIAVAAITVLLLVSALWKLRRGELPENRWRRALTFALPGLGLGFVSTFTMSALRWLVPAPSTWTALLLVGAAVGFALGYLTPTPSAALSDRVDAPDDPAGAERTGQGEQSAVEVDGPDQVPDLAQHAQAPRDEDRVGPEERAR
jgi:hypothetical protein